MKIDHYQLVAEINQAFEESDVDFLAAHLAEKVQWDITGSRPIIGKEAFLKCCSEASFKDGSIKITLTQILVDGNHAAADGIIEAETLAGKPYRQSFCDLYEFEGERIKTMRSYLDTAYDKEILGGGTIYQKNKMQPITVSVQVNAPIELVWKLWNTPDDIRHWNNISDKWHTPSAQNDLRPGGKLLLVMGLKDGSFSFDFEAV